MFGTERRGFYRDDSGQLMVRMITQKRYQCGGCGRIFKTSTNHWGVIYTGCRGHMYGCTVTQSECVEAEMAMLDIALKANNDEGEDNAQRNIRPQEGEAPR
jgi:hypothetical protein